MPSRSNRLRNRKALTGNNDVSDEDDIALLSEGEATATSASSSSTPSKRPSRAAAASKPRTRTRSSKPAPIESPNRLRRLMSILLATTLLLALYQGARLYVRSSLEASASCDDGVAPSGPLAKIGRGNVGEFVKSLWPQKPQRQQHQPKQKAKAQVQHQAVGGMVLHPSANDDDDASSSNPLAPVLTPDNSDIKLEDLDMVTLQAAFDALYGDDGPLGPQRGGEGEDGAYRVGRQGRREGFNEL